MRSWFSKALAKHATDSAAASTPLSSPVARLSLTARQSMRLAMPCSWMPFREACAPTL